MKRKPKIEIKSNGKGPQRFRWRLVAGNGEIVHVSETFPRKANAVRAALRAQELMMQAELVG